MYITLDEAKKHLLIDDSFSLDDEYILALIDVAEDAVAINIDIALEDLTVGGELPPAVKAAILLLVGNLYANREPVAYASVNKVPYTFDYLISLYKNYK
ncbi:MAG: head-tail connector protein [Firmicutes bacterium]|nr:head-tail connector protein [Bacillota bacterium]